MAARILVIEADDDTRMMLEEALRLEGYDVLRYPDPPLSLDEVVEARPDLVLLDWTPWHAPLGLAWLQRLKADALTATIPVIVTSADYTLLRKHAGALHAMHVSICPKPYDLPALLDAIAGKLAA